MYIEHPTIDQITKVATNKTKPGQTFLILIAENTQLNFDELVLALNAAGVTFFGGIFPALLYDREKKEEGIILHKFGQAIAPVLVTGLDSPEFSWPEALANSKYKTEKGSGIVFIDGLTSNVTPFLSKLYNTFAGTVNFFGGGAGSLSLQQQPCIISNQGIHQNAAIVAFLDKKLDLGVKHGWSKASGPIVVTKSEKNIINELNWRSAFEIYQEILEGFSLQISSENFFDIAKSYPFGLFKEGSEDIVRDPIATDPNGNLICVGDVKENSVVNILRGNPDSLIASATKAAEQAVELWKPEHCLIADCISRVLYLENDFNKEVSAIKDVIAKAAPDCTPEGALTLGEISSFGEGYPEFLNKSIVIANFHD